MSDDGNKGHDATNETIEVTCPTCKAKVSIAAKEAERTMKARCPKGHEIPLVKAL